MSIEKTEEAFRALYGEAKPSSVAKEVTVIDASPYLCERFAVKGKSPKTVMRVHVKQAYMQCAKALMRSKLWGDDYKIERSQFPSMGEILKAHTQHDNPIETREQMLERYKETIY